MQAVSGKDRKGRRRKAPSRIFSTFVWTARALSLRAEFFIILYPKSFVKRKLLYKLHKIYPEILCNFFLKNVLTSAQSVLYYNHREGMRKPHKVTD